MKILFILTILLPLIIASLVTQIALEHNPQYEFVDEAGGINYANVTPLFLGWFALFFIPLILIFILFKILKK